MISQKKEIREHFAEQIFFSSKSVFLPFLFFVHFT